MADELVIELGQAWQAQDWNRAAVVGEQLATGWPQDPRVGVWWYDAALARKFLRDWPEAYRLGRHAAAHASAGGQDPAFWNLGIAATIMREWGTARAAWEGFGITLPPGDGPIDGELRGRLCPADVPGLAGGGVGTPAVPDPRQSGQRPVRYDSPVRGDLGARRGTQGRPGCR